jgi:hypothetical protein
MSNPYEEGIPIEVYNPVNKKSTWYDKKNATGGSIGFDFLDTPEESIKNVDKIYNDIKFYPEDLLSDLRNKIFLITSIPPFRQHIIFTIGDANRITYDIFIGGISIDIDLVNDYETTNTDNVLKFPVDRRLMNNKDDITVDLYENYYTLAPIDGFIISSIRIIDLYDIVNPQSSEIIDIMKNEFHERILFYSVILKYYPIITYEIFNMLYKKHESIEILYEYLDPQKASVYKQYMAEFKIMNAVYSNLEENKKKYSNTLVRVLEIELETNIL